MIESDQCPSHTRQPWGTPAHRISPGIRYLLMAILVAVFVGGIVVIVVVATLQVVKGLGLDQSRPSSTHIRRFLVPEYHPPFRTCGDQFHSCEAHSKPNICCPFATTCEPNPFSSSGIQCCMNGHQCIPYSDHPPQCVPDTTQCSIELGGGCCPKDEVCSLEGCIRDAASNPSSKGSIQYPSVFKAKPPTALSSSTTGEGDPEPTGTPEINSISAKFGEVAVILFPRLKQETHDQKSNAGSLAGSLDVRLGWVVLGIAAAPFYA